MDDETPYAQATQFYTVGDIAKCIEILRREAAAGDADCQTFLGTLYHEGEGVEKDVWRAIKLYEQAAAQTNLRGTYILGSTFYLGLGVPKDKSRGLRLIKRAAFMNLTEAQMMLAEHYQRGFFSRKMHVSVAWCLVAAHYGHASARQIVERAGNPPNESIALAQNLVGAIDSLQLLSGMNPNKALERLSQIETEEWT